MVEWITEVGGEVMFSDYQGTVDYLITPLEGNIILSTFLEKASMSIKNVIFYRIIFYLRKTMKNPTLKKYHEKSNT